MLVPFFITPDRISGYEQFAEILTKKKSNQKKKGVNNQNNSASYFRLCNTELHHHQNYKSIKKRPRVVL
jgi:hypothetical protein